jgi:hypothetical protein
MNETEQTTIRIFKGVKIMKFYFTKDKTNNHGGQVKGKESIGEMVRGWRLVKINLLRETLGFSVRFILYFPSGRCWYFDFFSKRCPPSKES